jgi:hypothetical protein
MGSLIARFPFVAACLGTGLIITGCLAVVRACDTL